MNTDTDEQANDSMNEDNFNDSIPLSSRQRTKVRLIYSYKTKRNNVYLG